MLVADGGGGGGGTNWYAMDVPTMWNTIANQDTTAAYERLTGWQKSYELILEHMAQVQNYRENLAAAWPPEKSAASAAYVGQLDDMLDSLQRTYDAAVTNHTAFSGATLSMSLTRNDLEKIYEEYASNQIKLDEFANESKPVQYGKVPVLPLKSPVPAGRQEDLNSQARLLMSNLSTDLGQAQASLVTPDEFLPPTFLDKGKEEHNLPVYTPPLIAGDDDSSANTSGAAGRSPGSQPNLNPTAGKSSPSAPPAAGSQQPGLVLGGASAPPNLGSPTLGSPASPTPNIGPSGGPGPINVRPSMPITPIDGQFPPAVVRGVGASQMPSATESGQFGVGRSLGADPRTGSMSGIIGGPSGAGLGRNSTGRGPIQRVNPVGGVIGGSEGGDSAKTGRTAYAQSTQPPSTGPGRKGRRDQGDPTAPWDPDNPWETAQGVAPVVLPVAEQRVDPGPAIGLG